MTSDQVLALLAKKHAEDVFVPECKSGSTWAGSHVRLDAWAMKRTWIKNVTYGYEVKVARSDFLRDDKWPAYLTMCNQFSFVCPYGLIDPKEVPEGCGLIMVAKTATRLYTKLKAPYRDQPISEDLLRYVIMSRAKITSSTYEQQQQGNVEYWRRWLATKIENRELGHRVSRELRHTISQKLYVAEAENDRLKNELAQLQTVKKFLDENGINPGWNANRRIREALDGESVMPIDAVRRLKSCVEGLERDVLRVESWMGDVQALAKMDTEGEECTEQNSS